MINRAEARRLNRNNQKAKKALAATSTEATPERSVELGKRPADAGSSTASAHPTKKARLDSTVHIQETRTSLADSTPVDAEMTQGDRDDVIETVALMDAGGEGVSTEVADAVIAAEEAGLQEALAVVTREEDATME